MIAARSGRTDITNILLNGEHIDLDIQENVRIMYYMYICTYIIYEHYIGNVLIVHVYAKYKLYTLFMFRCIHVCTDIHTCTHIHTYYVSSVCVCVIPSPTEDWMVCSILLC